MSGFDLATLDTGDTAEEGSILELRNPSTGELLLDQGQPVTIRLAGEDSPQYRKAQHAAQNRRLQRGNLAKLKAEELESDTLEIYAACTLGWRGLALDGEELPCTKANALMLYRRPGMKWLADQVADFIRDRANFLPASPTNSLPSSSTSSGSTKLSATAN